MNMNDHHVSTLLGLLNLSLDCFDIANSLKKNIKDLN